MNIGRSNKALQLLTRSKPLFFLLALSLVPSFGFAADCTHNENTFKCVEYQRNYDGDTLTVRIPSVHPLFGENINVRVLGIDAPEMRSDDPCERQAATKAKELLKSMLQNSQQINLRSIGRDKYFRVLAQVEVDGVDLSTEMVRKGYAVPYDGGAHPEVNWCNID